MTDPAPSGGKAAFKFGIEGAVTINCTWAGMVAPAHLKGLLERAPELPPCQVYAVAHRPRVHVEPSSFARSGDALTLGFFADLGGGRRSDVVELTVQTPFPEIVSLRTENHGAEVQFNDARGALVTGGAASGFLAHWLAGVPAADRLPVDEELLDLKVVYVGQSMDEGGAPQRRLLGHKALQQALADIAQEAPHLEPWVILMAFDAWARLSMIHPMQTAASIAESIEHYHALQRHEPTLAEQIAVAEAALIRYFQPRYNRDFVDHFPDQEHLTYNTFFDADVNSIGVEFETLTTLRCRLWSDVATRDFFHSRLFPLHDEKLRRAFFDFHDGLDLSRILIKPEDRPPRSRPT